MSYLKVIRVDDALCWSRLTDLRYSFLYRWSMNLISMVFLVITFHNTLPSIHFQLFYQADFDVH